MTQVVEALAGAKGEFITSEAVAASGSAIKPGYLVELTASGEVQEHSTAAGNASPLVAMTNLSSGGDIDTVYAVGETVRYGAPSSGQEGYLVLAAGATAVTPASVLESAGDGTVRVQSSSASTGQTARDSVVAYPLESVDNSGGATEVKVKVRFA